MPRLVPGAPRTPRFPRAAVPRPARALPSRRAREGSREAGGGSDLDLPDLEAGAVVHAETEVGRVLHVAGLPDDDVHVRVAIPGVGVVGLERPRRAVPDRDRAFGLALGVDDV